MRFLKTITEDEMVALFLQTEIHSFRFRKNILNLLRKEKKDRAIVEHPTLSNKQENTYRKHLLGEFRGYHKNKELFEHFPFQLTWKKALLTKEELKKIKYINWDYWLELSNSTRKPSLAAEKIKKGLLSKRESKPFLNAATYLNKGGAFKPLILVSANKKTPLVVLEGHLRLTSYFLSKKLPSSLEVIIGYSPNIKKWDLY